MNYVSIFAAASALVLTGVSQAAPVYLECSMSNGKEVVVWNVTLDEVGGTVSYTIPEMGVAQKYTAIFTSDKVIFKSMEISRIDLSFKRTSNLLAQSQIDTGQCKLADVPKRQF